MTRNLLLIAFLSWSVFMGCCQTPAPSKAPASPSVPDNASETAKTTVFHSDLLDLSLTYPSSLVAQALPSLKEQHDALAAQQAGGAKPGESNECADKALLALRQDDPNHLPPVAPDPGGQNGTGTRHAIAGKILISRMGVDCMPAAYRDQLDNVAASMAAALAQGRDLRPVDQPIWYEIGKTRVNFAAAEGATNEAGANSEPKPDSRWVGSGAFVWNGNLISIVVESNDISFFNEMLHSKLAVGKDPGARLFPAEIGKGKQIEPKP